ncbi:Lcl domain-containing protein [Flavobacterium lacus]|uniref:Lcl domain-containing protein n=1 Tax=Flavobacterium lacus TaxID=1353778 RepID=UPI0011BDD537|nr:DUF1566 domain-containing protein [Flavobacterium lacus]
MFVNSFVYAQVGIGTNIPNNTALLDVASTSQGFLFPRMTAAQRDAISLKAEGLMVYCTNCGLTGEPQFFNGVVWVTMLGGAAPTVPLVVGDTFQGGKIVYILQPSDPGYDPYQQHGIIAAPSDQSGSIRWSINNNSINGTSTALGSGQANTTAIVNSQGTSGNYAARLCNDLVVGGFSDWYLPSLDEMNILRANRVLIGLSSGTSQYWSSTQYNATRAMRVRIDTGSNSDHLKTGTNRVRAVRSF